MRLGKARKKKPTYCGRRGYGHGSMKSKIRYRTLKDAKGARTALMVRLGHSDVRIYKCPVCGGYHLTTAVQYETGLSHTVWRAPDRGISSEEGEDRTEEEQDDRG